MSVQSEEVINAKVEDISKKYGIKSSILLNLIYICYENDIEYGLNDFPAKIYEDYRKSMSLKQVSKKYRYTYEKFIKKNIKNLL